MRLAEVIGRWIGKVEVVLAGADEDLREGEDALSAGDPMRARSAAHRVLERAPDSPLGLALLADACEAAHLDAELAMTLERLAHLAPSRAEVWVRLARARGATQAPLEEVRDALARALGAAESGSEERMEALLGLADLDLQQGEGIRAELWLERAARSEDPRVVVRRAEARLLRGDPGGAMKLLDSAPTSPADGRAAFARGRALAALDDPRTFAPLIRAMVLDVPGASEALSSALARIPSDLQARTHVRSVVDAKGEQELARWRAAFARVEGARENAREALREAVAGGDRAAVGQLLDAAADDRDPIALRTALAASSSDDPGSMAPDARLVAEALDHAGERDALDALGRIEHPRLRAWARALVEDVALAWIPSSGAPAAWTALVARLDALAHAVGDLETASRVADLAAERSRPVRLAIVGEFNAGKSTFINALIGAEVAPTGVLPTTATLHHLRWAPDAFAKILFAPGSEPAERIVAPGDLRPTLESLRAAPVARVEIRLPLAALVRVEILDTPGFNALDPRHETVARRAFDEADIALWLLDATQPLKQSELAVIREAKQTGIPVQIVVNKIDRVAANDLPKIVGRLDECLAEARLSSWRSPVAFSAKRALAAKIGDIGALRDSGWPAVEALLEQEIVGRSDELKERALRRRAAGVVSILLVEWSERAAKEEAARSKAIERAREVTHAAGALEARSDDIAASLSESLEPVATAWARDADLVLLGRGREASHDAVLMRYRVDRALASLAPPLSRALSSLAPEAALAPADLLPSARAIVRAAVESSPFDSSAIVRAIARAGIATLTERLFAASSATPPTLSATGIVRELGAFAAALAVSRS
ncbi:MAG TPA: dynamin family protein [Polyangiaceae bacterium]|nr:dynamin family protein [Polyangiaceae bacterium]